MRVLTQTEARAVRDSIEALKGIRLNCVITILIGEGDTYAKVECNQGVVTVKNVKLREIYSDIASFASRYGI
jgi:hypothetical protein